MSERPDLFAGIPIHRSDLVPPGTAYVINQDYISTMIREDYEPVLRQQLVVGSPLFDMLAQTPTVKRGIIRRMTTSPFIKDLETLGQRAGWTFAETFLAVFAVTDISTLRSAAVAAVAAAIVPVKDFVRAQKDKLGN